MTKVEFERVARSVTPDKAECEITNKATPIGKEKKVYFQAIIKYRGHELTRLFADVKDKRIKIKGLNFFYNIETDLDSLRNDLYDECIDKIKRYEAWDNEETKPAEGQQLSLFGEQTEVRLGDLRQQYLIEANLNQIRSKQMNSSRDQDKRRNERANNITTEYMGISKFGIFNFRTTSQTHPGYFWYETIECPTIIGLADILDDPEEHIEIKDIDVLLKTRDVMIFCDCPDFLFSGFKYMAYSKKYGNKPESRPPKVRNPQEQGATCKHLYSVIQLIDNPNIRQQMAKDTEQWLHYMNGDKYTSFAKPVKAGQVKRKDKRLDWEDYAGEFQKYLQSIADNNDLLNKEDIEGSIRDYVDIVNKEKPTMTLDGFIKDLTGQNNLDSLVADMDITDDTEDLKNYIQRYFRDVGF